MADAIIIEVSADITKALNRIKKLKGEAAATAGGYKTADQITEADLAKAQARTWQHTAMGNAWWDAYARRQAQQTATAQQAATTPAGSAASSAMAAGGMGIRGARSALYGMGLGGVSRYASLISSWVPMTTGMLVVMAAIGAAFRLLKKEVDNLRQAMERGAALYSKSLSSGGLPLGFVSQRMAIGRVLGIGESEVMRFGQAMGELAKRTGTAADSLARTSRQLAAVEQTKRIVDINNEAAVAERARARSGLSYLNAKSDEWASKFNLWSDRLVSGWIDRLGLAAPRAANTIGVANRFDPSAWERMGMVIGSGGRSPAEQTARNTAMQVDLLRRLLAIFAPDAYVAVNMMNAVSHAMP